MLLRCGWRRGVRASRRYARPVRLYDETTGELRDVEIRPRMTMYVCGITPYDSSHLGHAFTYVHFDVLARYLRYLGAEVVHVQNVTDVDDDILKAAAERGVDFRKLAEQETREFERVMAALNVIRPTHSPRATEFVPQMIEEVRALLAQDCGYERNGTVYFRVKSDPSYGSLSRLSREEMLELAAERGGHPEDPAKDDPLDFVLWQKSEPGEPWWESPWGRGRPGWHIECSTMARRLLGQPVDVHGGGTDLIFPHHESELAQAEALPGPRPFVRHWVHTGQVFLTGEKMSKSLGNLVFVHDLLDRHDPLAVRRFLLRRRYRDDWDFNEARLDDEGAENVPSAADRRGAGAREREAFFNALDEDMDTPAALAILDRATASPDAEARQFAEEAKEILGL
jgi:L-cysteine:1D-myo-inositol 2-amino-2-deoxy-alpha-D-glucopyranoside ligase